MTGYTPADLAENWEFKILRSSTGAFKNPERFREAVEEEAHAGWVLVEKFDNSRLRFKRSASARSADAAMRASGGGGVPVGESGWGEGGGGGGAGIDPYRTTYGISDTRLAFTIVISMLGLISLLIFCIYLATRSGHTP